MEELGFTIAVPETLLIGFGITVVLAGIILMKVLKIGKAVEQINEDVDDINDRLKRMEKLVEKMAEK